VCKGSGVLSLGVRVEGLGVKVLGLGKHCRSTNNICADAVFLQKECL